MSEHLSAILKLLEHCSGVECQEVMQACGVKLYGLFKTHAQNSGTAQSVPTEVDWRPGVLPGDFGPEGVHVPTGGQLPPSKLDESINKGRW